MEGILRSLHDINLKLKGVKMLSDDSQPEIIKNEEQKPSYNPSATKPFVPRQYVKTQFYLASQIRNDNFLFNAFLNFAPARGDFFNIGDTLYEVVSVTRQLYTANDEGTFAKEKAVTVIVDRKRSYIPRRSPESHA